MRAVALVLSLAACHTVSRVEQTYAIDPVSRSIGEPPRALAPTAEITRTGMLAFVVPHACMMDMVKREKSVVISTIKPNLATVIVGLVLGSVGAVVGATGLATGDALTAVGGGVAVAGGVPMIALPFFGNKETTRDVGIREFSAGKREERCGEQPLDADSGVVTFKNIRVAGQIDPKGVFTIPVFHFIDAFDFERVRGEASALVNGDSEAIEWIIDAAKLTPAVDGFFRSIQIDPSIERLDKVPRLRGEKFAIVLDRAEPYPIALVSVRIHNEGPGTAWGVRARLDSAVPELRSRYLYIGRLGPKQSADPVLAIPLADPTIDLRTANLTLTILDAHKTAPIVPLSQPLFSVSGESR